MILLDINYKRQLKWVDSIYNSMNIDEKIGQLFMLRISSAAGQKSFDRIEKNISQNHIGGLIFPKITQYQILDQCSSKNLNYHHRYIWNK